MQDKLKPIFSIITLGLFLLLAFASFGPDNSTNTSVAISNCQGRPPVSGPLTVNIFYYEKDGDPIAGATGTIFIFHQKAETNCSYATDYHTVSFATAADGTYNFSGYDYTHTNSQDLYRVELIIKKSATHQGYRAVKALLYSARAVEFNCVGLNLDEL